MIKLNEVSELMRYRYLHIRLQITASICFVIHDVCASVCLNKIRNRLLLIEIREHILFKLHSYIFSLEQVGKTLKHIDYMS